LYATHLPVCQDWQTYGTHAQNGKQKFPWQAAFTAVPIFLFIYFARPASLYCEEYIYTYTHLTAWILYMNYCCYQIILRVQHFNTNRERCEVLTGYLSLECRPGGDWANTWHWTKCFTIFFSNRKW